MPAKMSLTTGIEKALMMIFRRMEVRSITGEMNRIKKSRSMMMNMHSQMSTNTK